MSAPNSEPIQTNRWRRYSDWDERPLRLDRFAREDPANGFAAFRSPADPTPGMTST
jgi:propanediol dehydratase large subunit